MTDTDTDTPKLKEVDIKNYLIHNKLLIEMALGNLGRSVLTFEKVVLHNNLRTDVLVYSEHKGLIGIENKSGKDNLKRLEHQLKDYSAVCRYVLVFIHESHLENVLSLLESLNMSYVGIITYSEYSGKIIAGVNRKASINPRQDIKLLLPTAWKIELQRMLTFNWGNPKAFLDDYKVTKYKSNREMLKSFRERFRGQSRVPRQSVLVRQLIEHYGARGAEQLFCNLMISRDNSIEKPLKVYDWNDSL